MNNDCLLWFFNHDALKCLDKFELRVVVKIVCEQSLSRQHIFIVNSVLFIDKTAQGNVACQL